MKLLSAEEIKDLIKKDPIVKALFEQNFKNISVVRRREACPVLGYPYGQQAAGKATEINPADFKLPTQDGIDEFAAIRKAFAECVGSIKGQGFRTPIFEDQQKCECGGHKFGFTEPGPGHSDWCAFYRKS